MRAVSDTPHTIDEGSLNHTRHSTPDMIDEVEEVEEIDEIDVVMRCMRVLWITKSMRALSIPLDSAHQTQSMRSKKRAVATTWSMRALSITPHHILSVTPDQVDAPHAVDGVATISRLLKIIRLFFRISSLL